MPAKLLVIAGTVVSRIAEVNPRRETLTIINPNPHLMALADNDKPNLEFAWPIPKCHQILIAPYSYVTLEGEDGDQPDHAWYIFCRENAFITVFEGMTPTPKKRWW